MSAKFEVTGSSAGAVKAIQDLQKAIEATEKSAEGAVVPTKKLEEAAKRLAQQADPQLRYNEQMRKLAEAVKGGGLEISKAETLAERYHNALKRTASAGDEAFGAGMVRNIGQMAMAITGITGGLDLAIDAMRNFREEQKKAADDAVRARAGIGQLSQLAASDANPQAAFKSLVGEADAALRTGAAADRNEAASLIFDLAAAGIDKPDRDFAVRMRSTGTLTNVGGLASAYDALRTAMGEKEVGTFEQFASKALAAGAASPGSVEALPVALARAGSSARALGISDESVFAAGGVLAKEAGSPSEGGTKLAALLSGIQRSGIDVSGMNFSQMIDRISTENTGFGGVFKDNQEAISAFRTISANKGAFSDLEQNVFAAQNQGLADQAIGLPNLDPSQRAANMRARAEGGLSFINDQNLSRGENLRQAALADWSARMRREQPGLGTEWAIATERFATNIPGLGSADNHLRMAASAAPGSAGAIENEELLREIRDYLKDISLNTADTQQTLKSGVTTRQE
jgi:hypothetical protein